MQAYIFAYCTPGTGMIVTWKLFPKFYCVSMLSKLPGFRLSRSLIQPKSL